MVIAPAPDGSKFLLNIALGSAPPSEKSLLTGDPEAAAAAARAERLERLDTGGSSGIGGGPSLRPTGPSLRPAGPLAPPSPKRSGSGPSDVHGGGKTVAKLGTYQYTKPQLVEIGKRCVRGLSRSGCLLVCGDKVRAGSF